MKEKRDGSHLNVYDRDMIRFVNKYPGKWCAANTDALTRKTALRLESIGLIEIKWYGSKSYFDIRSVTRDKAWAAAQRMKAARKNPEYPIATNSYPSIYETHVRLRGYNGPQTVFSAHGRDKAKIVKVLFPHYGKLEHANISGEYFLAAKKASNEYSYALDQAARRAWGRPFYVTDYKVSGIGSNEFAERDKAVLRKLVRDKQHFADISAAHYYAARGKVRK